MTAGYGSWPGPVRAMATSIDAAVTAARTGDAEEFAAAVGGLRDRDRAAVSVVLGAVTRDVLERSHPDGLDAEDAEEALRSCIRAAAGWYRELDSDLLIRALTDAMGVSDVDDLPPADQLAVLRHGLLLIADQLAGAGQELEPLLAAALRELMRAETVELP